MLCVCYLHHSIRRCSIWSVQLLPGLLQYKEASLSVRPTPPLTLVSRREPVTGTGTAASHPPTTRATARPPGLSCRVGHACWLLRRQGHQDLPRPPRRPRRRRRRPRLPRRPPPLRQVQLQPRQRDRRVRRRRRRRVPARPARTRRRAARHRRSPAAHDGAAATAKSHLSLPVHRLAAASVARARDPSAAAAAASAGAPSAAPATSSSSRATPAAVSVAPATGRDRVAPTGVSDTAASRRHAAAAGCPRGAQPGGVLMPLILLDWIGLRAGR